MDKKVGHLEETVIHRGWLHLEQMMRNRHGDKFSHAMRQGMQSAYYMGAMAVFQSKETDAKKFGQIETGLADAMGAPNMRLQKI